jgi:hypothetical protein
MSFFILLLKYFFVFHFVFFFGKLLRSFVSLECKAGILDVFYNVLIGVLSSTFIYSLIKSGLATSLVLIIPIVVYFLYINRINTKRFTWGKIDYKSQLFPFYLILFLIFIYQSSTYFDFFTFRIKYLFVDNYTYANVVSILHDFGVENVDYSINKYLPNFQHELVPYRYADLWFSAFVIDLVDVKDIESVYLITIPLFISLLSYFFYVLILQQINDRIKAVFLSLLLLFLSIVFIPFLNSGVELPYLSETSVMGTFQQKLVFSSLFFALGFYYWQTNRENAILFFMFVPLFYVAYLPAIWFGLYLYLVIIFIKNRFNLTKSKLLIRLFLLLTTVFISYWFFYKVNGRFFLEHNKMSWREIPIFKRLPKEIIDPTVHFNLKAFLANLFFYSIPQIFYYLKGAIGNLIVGSLFFLPFVFLLFRKLKAFVSELKFVLILLIIGMFFTVLKDGDYNNYQFYTNGLAMLSTLFSIIFIRNFSSTRVNYFFYLLIVFGNLLPIYLFRNKVSSHPINFHFIQEVQQNVKFKKNDQVLCFVSNQSFDGSFYSWIGGNVLLPINQISNTKIHFTIANPSVFFEVEKPTLAGLAYDWSSVKNWTEKNKKQELDFITAKNIKYLLFYPSIDIPKQLQSRVKTILISKGYKFIVLN